MDMWKKQMASDPNWQELFRVTSDKQLAIRILRKQKELYMSRDSHELYEKGYDPAESDGLTNFTSIQERIDRQVMKELGLEKYVKDLNRFKIMKIIMPFMGDPEVMAELKHIVMIGNPMNPPEIGSVRLDVDLVSMETKDVIPLSQLHSRRNQPLVIIASSLS